jgi:hypothetical protein
MMEEKTGIEGELNAVREEAELCLLQMNQAQEELSHYSLELQVAQDNYRIMLEQCALKDEKLHWLRGQRILLIGLIKYQASVFQRFTAISVRLTRALKPQVDGASASGPRLLHRLKKIIPGSGHAAKQIDGAPLD